MTIALVAAIILAGFFAWKAYRTADEVVVVTTDEEK